MLNKVWVTVQTISMLMALAFSASAAGVGVLYLKNNGSLSADIWVNGAYQGYVPAGQARQTVSEGFVTNDSGFQPDGKLKQTYSHGGWENRGDTIEVLIQQVDSKNRVYRGSITVTGDVEHKGYVWFGESDAGKEPESVVWENEAAPIPNASAHYTGSIKEVYRLYAETRGGTVYAGLSDNPDVEYRVSISNSGAIEAYEFILSRQEKALPWGGQFDWSRSGNTLIGKSRSVYEGYQPFWEIRFRGNEPYSFKSCSDPEVKLHKLTPP